MALLQNQRRDLELGASLIEYALGLSLITIIVITCGTVLGNKTNRKFQDMNCKMDDAATTGGGENSNCTTGIGSGSRPD